MRWHRVVLLACVFMCVAASAYAQATPYDAPADSLITFITHHLGPLLLIVIIMIIGLAAGFMMHSPGTGIMVVVIGIFVAFIFASAINGNALAWFGVTSVVQ